MSVLLLSGLFAVANAAGPTFLFVGDWGGADDAQPTTESQKDSAAGMAKVAQEMNAQGILMLGDNFYSHGVDDVHSKRFKETFEQVYTQGAFPNLPFHVVAGNHDHLGNVQAQIDYHQKDARWNFPSLYWNNLTFDWKTAAGESRRAQIVMIDTPSLAGITEDHCVEDTCRLMGPENVTAAEDQWSWIEDQLKASTADFLYVAGHYPMYSAGDDGTQMLMVDRLLPMLQKYNAHYLCGHDHLSQHILYNGVHQFQQGMGRECCYGLGHLHTVPANAIQHVISGHKASGQFIGPKPPTVLGGFNSIAFGDEVATVVAHKEDGVMIYNATVPRRQRSREAEEVGIVV
eukprot:TRINITY_DN1652_c0_g1_i1.p1 TRINITY_DN1652_c0_g1~~TRINITY_DN1652_c0_g1_i1.p1  ORF type:complete len:368 (-),score=46.95 TRINITY_DN1652_c0_g1_i1:422-1456(-)